MEKRNFGLNEAEIKDIKAQGWIKKYFDTQAKGLTGNMDKIGGPFVNQYWGNYFAQNIQNAEDVFLGGMEVKKVGWVPFEQTAYWIDGMLRCGYLAENDELIEKAKDFIYKTIDLADEEGYLGPNFLKDDTVWAHAVFFRAMIAEYSATKNQKVLEALKKHFLRAPLADVYDKYEGGPTIGMRNVTDLEIALWLYGETGDTRFLDMAEESYQCFNSKYYDDKDAKKDCKSKDVTVRGMLGNRKVCNSHGVTYNEVCKIAAIMYQYTGKEIYKKAAVNAFDKLYRDQMLIDGVHSSSEYLNGNEDSWASHETCDVSDFTWAVGYLYMITKDSKYGDWIEDAIFNAGLGSVDDDFKGQQYFSCPNQVICDDVSNHNKFYRGADWMSYAPKEFLCCCAGNVHRFMPNYLARAWMTDDKKGVYATLYGPSTFETNIDEKKLKITEITEYPFRNNVKFVIDSERPMDFVLYLRHPGWAKSADIYINNEKTNYSIENGFYEIKRTFSPKDIVEIYFETDVKLVENARGISVKYGALLYALPVEETVVIEGLRELENPEFPHYSIYPNSKWNFGFDMSREEQITVELKECGEDPWRNGCGGTELVIPVREVTNWKLRNVKKGRRRRSPRGYLKYEIGHECKFTPIVREKIDDKYKGNPEFVKLVPYGTTRLRIAIFPKV